MNGVRVTVQGSLGVITLERPEKLHVLNVEMIEALLMTLNAFLQEDQIHALVIQAAPSKAFCAGGDVRLLYDYRDKPQLQTHFFKQEYALNALIGCYPKPYIALLDGMTIGGGVGISLHGSHRVASKAFSFSMPETAIGFFPDIGASHLLSNLPYHLGVYLGLTGARINSDIAKCAGLVDVVAEAADFPAILDALSCADLKASPFEKVSAILRSYQHDVDKVHYEALCQKTQAYFGYPSVSAILQALQENNEYEMQEALLSKSPLSLKVTLALLSWAQGKSLDECLLMDAILVQHFMKGTDFYEGVRALLVDKDKSPQWQPKSLEEVTEEMVLSYFTPESIR